METALLVAILLALILGSMGIHVEEVLVDFGLSVISTGWNLDGVLVKRLTTVVALTSILHRDSAGQLQDHNALPVIPAPLPWSLLRLHPLFHIS